MRAELIASFLVAAVGRVTRENARRSSASMTIWCAASSGHFSIAFAQQAAECPSGWAAPCLDGRRGRRRNGTVRSAADSYTVTTTCRIFSPSADGVNRGHDMEQQSRLIAAAVFLTAVFARALAAEPTGEALMAQPHDCVIRPFIVAELGSPANGLLEQVMVDRGQRVAKGMVVAKLRSDLEQASLDLAKARAESTALINLARARVSLLKKEVSRNSELHTRQF